MMELPSAKTATSATRQELVHPTFVAQAKVPSAFILAVNPSASLVEEMLIEFPKLAVRKNIPLIRELPSLETSTEKASVRSLPPAWFAQLKLPLKGSSTGLMVKLMVMESLLSPSLT